MPEDLKDKTKEEIYEVLFAEITRLKHQLEIHQKALFGQKSERFIPEVPNGQLSIFEQTKQQLEEEQHKVEPTVKQTVTYEREVGSPKKKGRQPLPAHLPRVDIVLEPEGDFTGWILVRNEITEELDYSPANFRVNRYIRPVYAHPDAKTNPEIKQPLVMGDLPSRPIDKGIPSAQLLAYILISKFVDHLPYYRQMQMFKRIEVDISTSTIDGWVARVLVLLEVLYNKFCEHHFKEQFYLQVDETTIKVLKMSKQFSKTGKPKKGKSHTGYFWVYNAPLSNNVVFKYDPGRGGKYPAEHLKDFRGELQTDGYCVYEALDKLPYYTFYGCMSHIRRKFVDAQSNDAHRANTALTFIQQLYALEDFAREKQYTSQQRLELRKEKAQPVMEQFKEWLTAQRDAAQLLPSSPIGQAISYALGRWKYMERYLENGHVEIDNNGVENAIRPVAIGRKNYLFAGSPAGAKWAAIVYTLVASAARHGLNPQTYMADILRRLPDMSISQLHTLFPANWAEDVNHPLYPPDFQRTIEAKI
jgi:transposase